MSELVITAGPLRFTGRLETADAPLTCEAVLKALPLTGHLLHVRWSGEAAWVPFGARSLGLPPENATSHPLPGQVLLYPGGVSEMEILIPYGPTHFASISCLIFCEMSFAQPTKKPAAKETPESPRIKVQLDHRTMLVVHSMQAFKLWKKRYPLAKVIA